MREGVCESACVIETDRQREGREQVPRWEERRGQHGMCGSECVCERQRQRDGDMEIDRERETGAIALMGRALGTIWYVGVCVCVFVTCCLPLAFQRQGIYVWCCVRETRV